jgi:8-hydroxy-5-deazaflavin:NADPH oxidoreductase
VKIGILGATGPAGRGLIARLADNGFSVVAGSRELAKATAVVEAKREKWKERVAGITPALNAEAAAEGDLVVLATTWEGTVPTAREHAQALAGKVVVCMANAMEKVDNAFLPVVTPEGSLAEQVAAVVPDSLVSAAFHHVPAAAFAALDQSMEGDVVVVSDHPEAAKATCELVEAMPDLRSLDGGPLRNALALEAFCAVLVTVNIRHGGRRTLSLSR